MRIYKCEDLTGKVFGRLTVVALSHKTKNSRGKGHTYWKCLCSCGNYNSPSGHSLKAGDSRSCGCLQKEVASNAKKYNNARWRGCGEIPGKMVSSLKRGAESRGFEFSITKEYMWDLYLKQNKKCALSGQDLVFQTQDKTRRNANASLDRIDSTKGYVLGNVQWVTKEINTIKMQLNETHFINLCRQIAEYRKND